MPLTFTTDIVLVKSYVTTNQISSKSIEYGSKIKTIFAKIRIR